MKILQACSYFYPNIGGIEQVARDCASSFTEEKIEQKIICFNHEKGDKVDFVDGVEINRVGCFAKIASQSLSTHYGKALKKMMKEFQPDILIMHYPNPFMAFHILRALKKHKNVKLVLYWHLDIIKQKILGKLFKEQNKRLIKRACKIVATSPNYVEGSNFLSEAREKCIVIPNCANDDKIIASAESDAFSKKVIAEAEGKTILVAAGRHVPYKGIEYLVRASKFLSDDYKIFICGSGPLTDDLKKLASGDEKITFTGRISDDELKGYLQACDIFCFPSITKNEAFGIALAEGMAYSKPAVTFTIEGSGVNYVNINGVTGLEVANGNVEEYAKAIEKLAKDSALRDELGKNARERVVNNFTYALFRENVKKLISEL